MTELYEILLRDMRKHTLTPALRARAIELAYKRTCVPDCACKRPARRALAADMMPLVLRCAKQLTRNGAVLDAEFEDLVQAGALGLMQAIESYDPEHAGAAKLATWASWYIKRAMILENIRTPVVPRAVSVESYTEGYEPEGDNGDSWFATPDYAFSSEGDPAHAAEHESFSRWIREKAFSVLSPQEYLVIAGLYFRQLGVVALANEMGTSHQRISQLRTIAIQKLRAIGLRNLGLGDNI